jgi:hypothetical protein
MAVFFSIYLSLRMGGTVHSESGHWEALCVFMGGIAWTQRSDLIDLMFSFALFVLSKMDTTETIPPLLYSIAR